MVQDFDSGCTSLAFLHKKHIKGTEKEAIVQETTMLLCNLTYAVKNGLKLSVHKVYVTSKTLKHLYDKKPAAVYDNMLENIVKVVKQPDEIYQNKPGKRGGYLFYKVIGGTKLIVSIELTNNGEEELYVVTSFPTGENYLKNCTLTWSWRGGNPSS